MKLVSSINTRGTLDAKRNRVDEEVRDMTSFGQNIWFLQFFFFKVTFVVGHGIYIHWKAFGTLVIVCALFM